MSHMKKAFSKKPAIRFRRVSKAFRIWYSFFTLFPGMSSLSPIDDLISFKRDELNSLFSIRVSNREYFSMIVALLPRFRCFLSISFLYLADTDNEIPRKNSRAIAGIEPRATKVIVAMPRTGMMISQASTAGLWNSAGSSTQRISSSASSLFSSASYPVALNSSLHNFSALSSLTACWRFSITPASG